jgi:hypothetical protein
MDLVYHIEKNVPTDSGDKPMTDVVIERCGALQLQRSYEISNDDSESE